MANFNKVVKVLNIKSAMSLQLTGMEKSAIESSRQLTQWYIECVVFSIALALKSIACQLLADFIFKTFITLLKLAIGR